MVAWSPVTEAKWEARGIGWLGAGCTTPQRGRPGAKAEQASLLHVLSRSSLSLCRPPEGWLRCRAPRVTCHSLLPTFRLQSWPPGVGFPYTQIETRGLRTPGGRGGLWLEKASKNTPTGVACTVASMCPCSAAGPMPCPPLGPPRMAGSQP